MIYYIIGETVFNSRNDGALAPDGNTAWIEYEEWLADGNTPEIVVIPAPPDPLPQPEPPSA